VAVPKVEVDLMWDNTALKQGTMEAEADVERMADAVDAAATEMRTSLSSIDDGVSTTLGTGGTFSSGVDDVEAEGGRLKEVGSEVGAEFAANLQEGVASGDIKGTLLDTFSGLGAAAGATGQLGLAAAGVGVLLGATLIKGLTAKAAAERQGFVDAVNTAFEQIEIKATDTFDTIEKKIQDTFTRVGVVSELGGEEGLIGGYERINELVALTGVKFEEVVKILQGKTNPNLEDARRKIIDASDNTELWGKWTTIVGQGYSDNAKTAQDILKITEGNVREQESLGRLAGEFQKNTDLAARDSEILARNMNSVEESSRRIGENLGNAVRQAGLLDLAINGVER